MRAVWFAVPVLLLAVGCASSSSAPPAPPPAAPIANAGPDQAVASGALVTLDGSGSADPTGLPLTYAWTTSAGVTLSSPAAPAPTFTAPVIAAGQPPAALAFSLVVSDVNASSAPATVTITVNPVSPANPPPVAGAGPNQSVVSGAAVTLDGSASADPDGQAISYLWTQASGPTVTLSSSSAQQPTFTAPTVASGSPITLTFSLVVSDPDASSGPSTTSVIVSQVGTAFPPPPGTPPPAPPDASPPPVGGAGSHRFEMGTYLPAGLYLVDPVPGEASVVGFVVVAFGSAGGPAPADTVVTMNGVALRRVAPPGGLFWELDPAGPQPIIGSGGEMVLVARATDPADGKPIQRTLVLPCPSDIQVATTPATGEALVPSTALHVTSASNITLNDASIPLMAGSPPTATLSGYEPVSRALVGYRSPQAIAAGPLSVDVPVCSSAAGACAATTAGGYLLDLRWPGPFVLDGQSGGFCGLAKRFFFTK